MFNKGDIITGKERNGYGCTNNKALMVVINAEENSMEVMTIAHVEYGETGCKYHVENLESKFESINANDFYDRYPESYRMSDEDLFDKLVETNVIESLDVIKAETKELEEVEEETEEPINIEDIISAEERKKLIAEMKELLEEYEYHPTDASLNKIIDEWALNKGKLVKLFKKHPNYNGKFQIQFSQDWERKIDYKETNSFRHYLEGREVEDFFTSQKIEKIGIFSYKELKEIIKRFEQREQILDYAKRCGFNVVIDGQTHDEILRESLRFRKILAEKYNPEEYFIDEYAGVIYPRQVQKNRRIVSDLLHILDYKSKVKQFVNNETEYDFNHICPEAKIKEGQKLSRAVNKICKMVGIDKLPNYNKEFAKFADAVNPLKIKRHTILSVHPVDYLTMSFGNSWASCHTIDKKNKRGMANDYSGCYSSGTESYMLDGSSMVFYTVDGKYEGTDFELQSKINRNMFHYNAGQLVQGRMYPQNCDSGEDQLYTNVREIIQKIMADVLEKDNLWVLKKGQEECRKVIESHGTHYEDYFHYSNCNVSVLKAPIKHKNIVIGHYPICPSCGRMHDWEQAIECEDCYEPKACVHCGSNHDLMEIDGEYYCSDHYFYCEFHERYEAGEPHYIDRNGCRYCEDGADNTFYICEWCGDYIINENEELTTEDGQHYCCERCAEKDGYCRTEDNYWYPNDEVFTCECCKRVYHIDDEDEEMEHTCVNCANDIREEREDEDGEVA